MATLADEIGNDPVLLALLDRLQVQRQQLCATQAATDQHRDHRVIPQFARGQRRRALEEPPALLRRQPVSEAHADAPHSLHSTDTGRQFGTQKAGVGRLVGDAPNRGQSKIDGGRRISSLFGVNPISKHHCAVEREARIRAIPGDELANRVGALAASRRQAVEHRRLGVFEVRERQDALRRFLLARFRLTSLVSRSALPSLASRVAEMYHEAGHVRSNRRIGRRSRRRSGHWTRTQVGHLPERVGPSGTVQSTEYRVQSTYIRVPVLSLQAYGMTQPIRLLASSACGQWD
jgi:hypothetical protein